MTRWSDSTVRDLRHQIEDLEDKLAEAKDVIAGLRGEIDHQPVPGLTPMQSRIYRLLESRRGRVMSKQAIFDAIRFGERCSAATDPKIIDAWICHIRKRVPDCGIETVWGHGYRMT